MHGSGTSSGDDHYGSLETRGRSIRLAWIRDREVNRQRRGAGWNGTGGKGCAPCVLQLYGRVVPNDAVSGRNGSGIGNEASLEDIDDELGHVDPLISELLLLCIRGLVAMQTQHQVYGQDGGFPSQGQFKREVAASFLVDRFGAVVASHATAALRVGFHRQVGYFSGREDGKGSCGKRRRNGPGLPLGFDQLIELPFGLRADLAEGTLSRLVQVTEGRLIGRRWNRMAAECLGGPTGFIVEMAAGWLPILAIGSQRGRADGLLVGCGGAGLEEGPGAGAGVSGIG